MVIDVDSLYNRRRDDRFDRVAVGDITERLAYSQPNKEAIVAHTDAYASKENARLTYKQLDKKGNQFANALIARGLKRGDRVFFFCENSSEAFIAKLGVAKAGMVNVPVNTMMSEDVVNYLIDLTDPALFVADAEYWPNIKNVFSKNNKTLDITIPIAGEVVENSISFDHFLEGQSVSAPEVKIHGDDIWEILFTSGTTSMPKGVMISHHYTYLAGYNYGIHLSRGVRYPSDYKIISFLPIIYHVGDQTLPTSAFLYGGTLIIGRKHDVKSLSETITKERATGLWAGSAGFLEELTDYYSNNENNYDFSSITSILYGYAALTPEYNDKLKEICNDNLLIFESFSQTEVIAGFRFYHEQYEERYHEKAPYVNYVGMPDPSLGAILIDEKGERITEADKTGEVVYRSPIAFSGYYKDEKATKEALKDGWFHSEDGLKYDENGVGIMIGRYKDIIKTGGESVSSARVESVLNDHKSVKKAAVIGLPHEKWGEAVTGVIVLKENHSLSEEELISFSRERLAGYETPKRIIFEENIPETVGGKIQKYKLKEKMISKGK